jgi:predicted Zn-dependent protease
MGSNKHPCPCGSGKKAKLCCRPAAPTTDLAATKSAKVAMRKSVESLTVAGKHQEASEILERLVALSPHNPLIWNDLGVAYEAAGRRDDALTALRRGYQADSTYPPILYNLGKFTLDRFMRLVNDGELSQEEAGTLLAEAIRFLNANLDRDTENIDAHYQLAVAYALGQDTERAQAHRAVARRLGGD